MYADAALFLRILMCVFFSEADNLQEKHQELQSHIQEKHEEIHAHYKELRREKAPESEDEK